MIACDVSPVAIFSEKISSIALILLLSTLNCICIFLISSRLISGLGWVGLGWKSLCAPILWAPSVLKIESLSSGEFTHTQSQLASIVLGNLYWAHISTLRKIEIFVIRDCLTNPACLSFLKREGKPSGEKHCTMWISLAFKFSKVFSNWPVFTHFWSKFDEISFAGVKP